MTQRFTFDPSGRIFCVFLALAAAVVYSSWCYSVVVSGATFIHGNKPYIWNDFETMLILTFFGVISNVILLIGAICKNHIVLLVHCILESLLIVFFLLCVCSLMVQAYIVGPTFCVKIDEYSWQCFEEYITIIAEYEWAMLMLLAWAVLYIHILKAYIANIYRVQLVVARHATIRP